MSVHILLGSWRFSLISYLFKCLANFGAEWKSKLVYFVRLFFMADFLLVLGETPPSDPACRRVNKKFWEPKNLPSLKFLSLDVICYVWHHKLVIMTNFLLVKKEWRNCSNTVGHLNTFRILPKLALKAVIYFRELLLNFTIVRNCTSHQFHCHMCCCEVCGVILVSLAKTPHDFATPDWINRLLHLVDLGSEV